MIFGVYFRELRKSKQITQRTIAKAIGKSTMLISGVETSKNGPFSNDDLQIIADCLSLSQDEYVDLQIQAAKARGMLPPHMTDYIAEHDGVYKLLEILVQREMDEKSLIKLRTYAEGMK